MKAWEDCGIHKEKKREMVSEIFEKIVSYLHATCCSVGLTPGDPVNE